MDSISRLPGCRRTSSRRSIRYYPGSKWKMHQRYWKFQKVRMSRYLDTSTEAQMAKIMVQCWRSSCSSWPKSVRSSFGRTCYGKGNLRKSFCSTVGKRSQTGDAYSLNQEKGLFFSVYVDDIKLAGKKQNINPMWKVLNKEFDLGEPTSFLDHVYLGCTQRECQINTDIVDNYRNMFECRISAGAMENCQKQKPRWNLMPKLYLHGPMMWKVMQRNAWKDIANMQGKQLSNFSKSQRHAWMVINLKKRKMSQWENCPTVCSQIVLKCL